MERVQPSFHAESLRQRFLVLMLELTVVRELGQPSLLIDIDREKIARYGINISDVEAVIEAAVGGKAATQVIQGERLFDLVVRMQPQFRSSPEQIGNLLVGTPDGLQIPLKELADIKPSNGASFVYREDNSRSSACSTASRAAILSEPCATGKRPCDE